MNRKFYVFCILLFAFSIVFRGFSYLETGSGSGSGSGYMVAPSVVFTKWRIGRSALGTDINNEEHCSFITSTGTSCSFEASVGYKGGNQPKDTFSPINPSTVIWSVIDGNQGIESTSIQHNWSGLHPEKLSGNTSFNVVGKVKLDAYKSTTKPDLCKDENNHRRHERTPLHRDNTKLAFKIKFQADTKAGQRVSAVLSLEADPIDQIRQEYVDLNKPIPDRNESTWPDEDTYDFGHYKKMMNAGLDGYFQAWINSMNKQERQPRGLPNLTKQNFTLNSGYRNPHHNYHHSGSTVTLSPHMYGYALDVDGRDLNDIAGADQAKMVQAAYAANPNARWSQKYPNKTHVHADWAPRDWSARARDNTRNNAGPPPNDFSLPPAGTDTVACDKRRENNCSVMVSSSTEHYVTCGDSSCGESYWSCDSNDYDEHRLRTCTWERLPNGENCGKSWRACQYPPVKITGTQYSIASPVCVTDPNGNRHCAERNSNTAPSGGETNPDSNAPLEMIYACGVHSGDASLASSHSLQASCSETDSYGQGCTVTGFYKCQTHTHQYPALISGACGHTYTSDNASSHALQAGCLVTNANGDGCTVTGFYACGSHTHVYPVTCLRSGCRQSVSNQWVHLVRCSTCSKKYWSCDPVGVGHHVTVRTCRRTGCGVTFTNCTNGACSSDWGNFDTHWPK